MPPALSLSSLTMRWASLGPTPWARRDHRLVAAHHRALQLVRSERRQDGERHPRADALDRGQQPEPVAFVGGGETDQPDRIVGHLHLGVQHHLAADRAERGQRPGRGEDQIADALHVDHGMVGAEAVEQAAQLRDHAALFLTHARWSPDGAHG